MKPIESITLSFKCPKKIDDLQACNGGYYCDGCKKIIHDLRGLEESIIRQKMLESGSDFCGIFDRDSVKPVVVFPRWQRWASMVLLALGLTSCHDDVIGKVKKNDRKPPQQMPLQQKDTADSHYLVGEVAEISPTFPGGEMAFAQYLKKQIIVAKGVKGKVFVSFTVQTNGSLTNVKIVRGLDSVTDQRVVDALRRSPKWNPGIQNGKAIAIAYTVPVNFGDR